MKWWTPVSVTALVLLVLAAAIASGRGITPPADAQDAATPEDASPVATSPEQNRAARLGGLLSEVRAELGEPDWVDIGLVGYNSVDLGGVDTITMVYYDDQERVRSFLLVYLEQPVAFNNPETIARVVADVAPLDGTCADEPFEDSDLGDEVYACRSASLEGLYSEAQLFSFGVVGEDGSYSYAVDPTDDAFYEIAVRLGTESPPEPPTPVPMPTPSPAPPLAERYPPVIDIRDLLNVERYDVGEELSFAGTVAAVSAELEGTVMLVEAGAADGTFVAVSVVNDGDLEGIGPGSFINVYGIFGGFECDDAGFCTPTVYVIELD